jgi:hypothetical protein
MILEFLAEAMKEEKEIKGIQIEKEEAKLSLFADDVILNIEITKDSTKKLLEVINSEGCRKQNQHTKLVSFFYKPIMKLLKLYERNSIHNT